MQPLVILAIVGVAAVAMGTGFLGNPIDLSMVQLLGVGETDLTSPIEKANVDFIIAQDSDFKDGKTLTRNVIKYCVIESDHDDIPAGSKVWCKLTDVNDNVIAEGMTTLVNGAISQVTFRVPIDVTSFVFSNDVVEVHDIVVVVLGPTQTGM